MQLASEKQYLLTEAMQTNPQGHINGLVITKCQMSVSAFSAKSLYTMGYFFFYLRFFNWQWASHVQTIKMGTGPVYDLMLIPYIFYFASSLASLSWYTQEKRASNGLFSLFKKVLDKNGDAISPIHILNIKHIDPRYWLQNEAGEFEQSLLDSVRPPGHS